VRDAAFQHSIVMDVGAGAVRIGPDSLPSANGTVAACAHNVTISDSVLHDGGNIFRGASGVLLQAASDSTVSYNAISMFRCKFTKNQS